jgi:Ni,Fe-hydrogenase I large subunit
MLHRTRISTCPCVPVFMLLLSDHASKWLVTSLNYFHIRAMNTAWLQNRKFSFVNKKTLPQKIKKNQAESCSMSSVGEAEGMRSEQAARGNLCLFFHWLKSANAWTALYRPNIWFERLHAAGSTWRASSRSSTELSSEALSRSVILRPPKGVRWVFGKMELKRISSK